VTKPKNPYIVVLDEVVQYPAYTLQRRVWPERYLVKHYPSVGDFAWTANPRAAAHMGRRAAEQWADRVRNTTGMTVHVAECHEVCDRDLVFVHDLTGSAGNPI